MSEIIILRDGVYAKSHLPRWVTFLQSFFSVKWINANILVCPYCQLYCKLYIYIQWKNMMHAYVAIPIAGTSSYHIIEVLHVSSIYYVIEPQLPEGKSPIINISLRAK